MKIHFVQIPMQEIEKKTTVQRNNKWHSEREKEREEWRKMNDFPIWMCPCSLLTIVSASFVLLYSENVEIYEAVTAEQKQNPLSKQYKILLLTSFHCSTALR